MNNTIAGLILGFIEAAKELRPKYIEAWLNGEVKDFDMDMMLLDEKKCRSSTYKKLDELQNMHGVKP